MFALIDLVFQVGMATGKALGITLFVLSDVSLPQQLGQVAPVEMSSAAYVTIRVRPKTEEERCRYSGVVVPYERLWEERVVSSGSETVIPPEPGKIAGYAIVINRKDCDDRQPEAMLRVATHYRPLFNSNVLGEGASYVVLPLDSLPESTRPKWVPQVMETLAEAAASDSVAQEFLRFNAESSQLAAEAKAAEASSAN